MNRNEFIGNSKTNLLRFVGKKMVRKTFRNRMIPQVITIKGFDFVNGRIEFTTENTKETRDIALLAEYKELP